MIRQKSLLLSVMSAFPHTHHFIRIYFLFKKPRKFIQKKERAKKHCNLTLHSIIENDEWSLFDVLTILWMSDHGVRAKEITGHYKFHPWWDVLSSWKVSWCSNALHAFCLPCFFKICLFLRNCLDVRSPDTYLTFCDREEEMQELNRATNSNMALLSFFSLVVCLSVAGLQLWHLKTFFEKKKLIWSYLPERFAWIFCEFFFIKMHSYLDCTVCNGGVVRSYIEMVIIL